MVLASFAFLLSGFGLTGCQSGEGSDPAPQQGGGPVPAVEAAQAKRGSLPLTQRLSGKVRAENQISIYPQATAVVSAVLVENGQAVKEGQPLVRLRDVEFRQRLRQAEADLEIALAQKKREAAELQDAQRSLDRSRGLSEKQLLSQSDLEESETRLSAAQADLELAEARVQQAQSAVAEQRENLSYTEIRAPITGTVGNRNAEIGMVATPGTELFTLGQLDDVRVEVVLTDRMLTFIREGQRSEVTTAAGSRSAGLSRISPFLHPVTHSTEAEIDFDNDDGFFRPGMFVAVDVFYGESEEATLVPLSALYENPTTGGLGVYVATSNLEAGTPVSGQSETPSQALSEPLEFKFTPVDVIAEGRMEAAVSGIEEHMWVVTLGQNLLGGKDGEARARTVTWDRVEHMQRLQRDDLLESLVRPEATP